MANARTVDIKLKFDPTDMTPGAKGRKFRRDVLLHGGKTDARGFSITDSQNFRLRRCERVLKVM